MSQAIVGKAEQLQLLHDTRPGTYMGRLLRQFWHPIALSEEVAPGKARPLRVLSEDLTLYRGQSGQPHLVGGRCAHRCTVLHTGWIEGDDIRCMYHGWRFDASGLCTDIPAEKIKRTKPIRIPAYPTHEYAGLIFAYLGEGEAPVFDLPRKDFLEDPKRVVFAKRENWDCNWFQQVENSMDAVHLNFAHLWGKVGAFGDRITGEGRVIPELDYAETSSGVRQIATRSPTNVRVSDWTFPNNNHVVAVGATKDDPWVHISAWPVPIDNENTARFTLYSVEFDESSDIDALRVGFDLPYDPSHHAEKLFRGDVAGVSEPGLVSVQDYVAVRGQGSITNRLSENLSSSDAGVVFLRKVFLREIEALTSGGQPKTWKRLAEKLDLKPPPMKAAE